MSDKIFIEYEVGIAKLQADQKAVRDELKTTEKIGIDAQKNVAKAADDASNAVVKSKKKESDAVAALKAQLKEIEDVQKKLNEEAANTAPGTARQKLNKQIAETKFNLKEVQAELVKTVKSEEALTPPVVKLKTQLRNLKEELARATDPKEVIRLAKEVGTLSDQIEDAADAGKIFASDSKFEQVGNALGDVGTKLRNLDFKGAADQSKLLVEVVRGFSVKDAIEGVKDLGTAFLNVGKALLLNPLFLVAATLAAIGYAAYSVGKALYEVNVQTISVTEALADGRKALQEYADRFSEAQIKIKESLGQITKAQADVLRANVNFNKEQRDLNSKHSDAILALAKELDLDLRTLDAKGNATRLVTGGVYNANNLLLIKRFQKEKEKLDVDFQRQQVQLQKDQSVERSSILIADNQKRAQDAKDYLAKAAADQLAANQKANDDLIKEQERLQKALRDLRTANLTNDYDREKQALFNKFEDDKKQYNNNAKIVTELETALQRDLQKVDDKFFADKLQSEKDNLQARQDAQIEASLTKIDINQKTNSKILEDDIKAAADAERAEMEIQQAAFKSASDLASAFSQIQQNIIQQQLNDIDTASKRQIEALQFQLDNKIITQEEFARRKGIIDKRAAQEEANLKRRAFEKQKQASIIATLINTAQAVVAQLANPTPYVGFILAAVAAATGAAQLAVIESQPTPQFEKGGKINGKLHKHGGEIVEVERDEWIINRKSSIKNDKLLNAINAGREKQYIKEVYIAPALKQQLKQYTQQKQDSFAGALISSMKASNNFHDGNLLDSLKATRRNDRQIAEYMVRELKKNSNVKRHF